MFGLARAGEDEPEAALLDLGQQLVRALERSDLADQPIELLGPRLPKSIAVRFLDLSTGHR